MSSITGIGALTGVNSLAAASTEKEGESKGTFQDLLTNAIKEADDAYVTASEGTQALLTGDADNLAQIMVDSTKAELSLNLVIQVRNKIVDAYTEIMGMQV